MSEPRPGADAATPEQLPDPVALPLSERDSRSSLQVQLVRFIITGGLSAIVDFGLLTLFTHVFGLPQWLARTFSFIAGTTTAYMINRRWTFQAAASAKRFSMVVVLYALTFFLNVGLYTALVYLFLSWRWDQHLAEFVAFVIAQGIATAVNFVVQRGVIFRRPRA